MGILLLFTWVVLACAPSSAKPSLPANIVAEGWQDVQLQTVCLEVQQSFPDISPGFSLPVEPALRRVLRGLGLRVTDDGDGCDGVLQLSLTGVALAEDYVCILGRACGHCFTGAGVGGRLILTRSDRTPLVSPFTASISPPATISDCPEVPRGAPLEEVWPRAVLDGLFELWGIPVLAVALDDREESVREAAVRLLEKQGQEGVPLLVQALQDRSASVRERAANALGSQGAQASQAVPALVEVLNDDHRPVRLAAASALHQITGQDFGQDQATWRKWLEEPSLTPTPFTSWKEVPVMPGATSPEELGTLLQYGVEASCEQVAAFYQAEMPGAGWTSVEAEGEFVPRLQFEKGRETAEIHLSEIPVTIDQSRCNVQIFLLR